MRDRTDAKARGLGDRLSAIRNRPGITHHKGVVTAIDTSSGTRKVKVQLDGDTSKSTEWLSVFTSARLEIDTTVELLGLGGGDFVVIGVISGADYAIGHYTLTADQPISPSTVTIALMNSIVAESYGSSDYFTMGSDGVLTIHRAGWYRFEGGAIWESFSSDYRLIWIVINGTTRAGLRHSAITNSDATVSRVWYVNGVNIPVTFRVFQNSSTTLSLLSSAIRSFFTVEYLGY